MFFLPDCVKGVLCDCTDTLMHHAKDEGDAHKYVTVGHSRPVLTSPHHEASWQWSEHVLTLRVQARVSRLGSYWTRSLNAREDGPGGRGSRQE